MEETNNMRFLIRVMKKEDVEEVARLITTVHRAREPITKILNVSEEEYYEKYGMLAAETCVKEPLSFVCLDTHLVDGEQIVGFRLGYTFNEQMVQQEIIENKNFDPICGMITLLKEYKLQWFQMEPDKTRLKCFFFFNLGVKEGYEKLGIATKLTEFSINVMKQEAYDYVFVIASANGSQYIFERKCGFKEVIANEYENIEYKGIKFLKSITNPKKLIGYELNLCNWEASKHMVPNTF
ncbi:hypothetical protein B4U80_11833 [Leptotrombidium deliense]|uniref:N-acetyltransferase domain-containing protein n=1 Tax=Leptotrombidium deliense TaxID=299467 RepID=A0A443S1X5_9ACAR|nr:hypothetical protein B4U80_11833 [Leptotrombidium deliense]